MLRRLGYVVTDLRYWLGGHRRLVLAAAAVITLAAIGIAAYVLVESDDEQASTAPAPDVIVEQVPDEDVEETEDLGFPAFATKNTTRVAGAEPVATAAAVALAVNPAEGGVAGPGAVSLVDAADWQAGVAAGSLVAAPVGAPILVTAGDELPELTASALEALDPQGSKDTGDRQAFVLGAALEPEGLDSLAIEGADPAELAASVERLRTRLAGADPEHLLLVSADEPAFAMPAAAWAARSGDPVLFVERDSVPGPTAEALRRHRGVPVYVLGPESAVGPKALERIEKLSPSVKRVGDDDPVANAISFARYVDGGFGWNINDPGHGLVVANAANPLQGAVAAPLSASGTWGPLLVSDDAAEVPAPMRSYLLDLKPGYEDDPTRALYNHVWLIGDTEALSVEFQAQIDQLAELAQIGSGSGAGPSQTD